MKGIILLLTLGMIAIPMMAQTPVVTNDQILSLWADEDNVLKVYVDKKGQIKADKKKVSLEKLDAQMSALKQDKGVVYYSKANNGGDIAETSLAIMELVVKYGLPVRFFLDKSFKNPVNLN